MAGTERKSRIDEALTNRWHVPVWLAVALAFSAFGGEMPQRDANDDPDAWPSFRGVRAGGVAEGHVLPVVWDVAAGRNVLWRTPVAGLGHSSPVVWGGRVFLTTAVPESGMPAPLRTGLYGDIEPVAD